MSPQRTIDLPNAGGEEVHETVHGLLAGHHAVDVVPVQHAQLTGQPGWMEIILRNNIEQTERKMWFPPPPNFRKKDFTELNTVFTRVHQ